MIRITAIVTSTEKSGNADYLPEAVRFRRHVRSFPEPSHNVNLARQGRALPGHATMNTAGETLAEKRWRGVGSFILPALVQAQLTISTTRIFPIRLSSTLPR